VSRRARPGRRRLGRRTLLAAVVTATLLTIVIAKAGTTLIVSAPLERPDVIVSLASHEWERLPVAARLALKYPNAQILLTEPPVVSRRNCYNCGHRVDFLASLGVARDRVQVVNLTDSSTYGEALATRAFVAQSGRRRVLVVTSAYHTRRAFATFRRILETEPVTLGIEPADPSTWTRPARWWTRPYDRWYVSYEWAAAISNRVRHGVSIFSPDVASVRN
jgi:uncharacterized SAM-binding protein YcdF (DUF218 family)